MPKRKLKVEEFNPRGNYRTVGTASTLRLKGKWLQQAGFPAGATVELTAISPGVIEIRIHPVSEVKEA